ncbi:AlbA family DNA-binding domain-containing protein [Flavobacterium luteolum]|uniref:AlbA family DNA-binding domain-containing protein n=1 Tax=Flavobacterium luteolum TaxID=3003259 RepID=UPI00248E9AC7|nr:ATP-binding protein [Flavobacterium luteolum]
MQKVIEIIKYESESHKVDFKKTEYILGKDAKRNEILKDFSAFANHLSDDEKYIIIGIKENQDKTKTIFGVENPTDEAQYRQFINENIEPAINFEYHHLTFKGKTISFFRLYANCNRPYLFKKEMKNPINDKTEFKYGDGFIKVGTSTNKIGRKELDDIIQSKKKYINRKEDIDIIPNAGKPSSAEMDRWDVNYIDLKLINKSNRSIDLDVEIFIKKSDQYTIILEEHFLRKIKKVENSQKPKNYLSPINYSDTFVLGNLNINAKENQTEFIVQLNQLKNKFAINLKQNSACEDIFDQSIIVFGNKAEIIEAKVIIRSDDFTDGAFSKIISFKM